MTTEQTNAIRRHEDGSIDTAHYVLLGRAARSRSLHDLSERAGHLSWRAAFLQFVFGGDRKSEVAHPRSG